MGEISPKQRRQTSRRSGCGARKGAGRLWLGNKLCADPDEQNWSMTRSAAQSSLCVKAGGAIGGSCSRVDNRKGMAMNDFLGMGQIIKEQTAELERLRREIAHRDQIIAACDEAMNRMRLALQRATE